MSHGQFWQRVEAVYGLDSNSGWTLERQWKANLAPDSELPTKNQTNHIKSIYHEMRENKMIITTFVLVSAHHQLYMAEVSILQHFPGISALYQIFIAKFS